MYPATGPRRATREGSTDDPKVARRARAARLLRAAVPLLLALAGPPGARADPASAVDWKSRLDGRHFSAEVTMHVDLLGRDETRAVEVWRDDVDGQRERLLARFERPYDLRGLGLLYIENRDRANDYFVYQPSTERVRRISRTVANQDIYGVDLEFLGFGLAQAEPTTVESSEVVEDQGRELVRIDERAKHDDARFDRRVVWVDPENLIPMRMELRRGDRVVLVARTERVTVEQGVPTPRRVVFERPDEAGNVTMTVERIDYEAPIPQSFFSTLELIK